MSAVETAWLGRDFGDVCSGMFWMMMSAAIRSSSHGLGRMYRRIGFSCMSGNGSDVESQVGIQQVTWPGVCKASLGKVEALK